MHDVRQCSEGPPRFRFAEAGEAPFSPDAKDALASLSEATEARSTFIEPARARRLVAQHFDFVWRSLRRLGVPEPAVDDAAQSVFLVAASKLRDVPLEKERSFLFGVAMRVASVERRALRRRRETLDDDDVSAQVEDAGPPADVLLERSRARAVVDRLLEGLPLELRVVFVLFEMEEMPTQQIATMLGIPVGTVASRLRRAREEFEAAAYRFRAQAARGGAL